MTSDRVANGVVEICVPASSDYVATVRLAAASLGALCDLTVDEIEDLRLVVDEAFSLVLAVADPAGTVDVRFELSPGCLAVHASTAAGESTAVNVAGFGWTVLEALAETVETRTTDGRVTVGLIKRAAQRA